MHETTIETIIELPPAAVTVCAVCLAIAIAGLGIWLAAPALAKLIRLYRRTLAAEMRLQHIKAGYDNAAINYWIRDSFRNKRLAAVAEKSLNAQKGRATQERSLRKQIAGAADTWANRKETESC